jgi:hypothetical protein
LQQQQVLQQVLRQPQAQAHQVARGHRLLWVTAGPAGG